MSQFLEEVKKPQNSTLTTEFLAGRTQLIMMVNRAEIGSQLNQRLRKGQDFFQDAVKIARKQVLEISKQASLETVSGFRGMTRARYKETHDGREPEADNVMVTKILRNGVMEESVLIPKDAEGEYDVNVKDKISSNLREEIDDGANVLTANQIQLKFNKTSNAIVKARHGLAILSQITKTTPQPFGFS